MKKNVSKIVRKARSNFFWSFVFLDDNKRDAIFAIYAFARQTDDLVDDAPSIEDASDRLHAWRDELASCYTGSPSQAITIALQPVVERYNIPKTYFDELINGVEMDLTKNRYATFAELEIYCYRVASVVGLICIEIFGYSDTRTKDYAIDLGMALQLTNILRDVGEDAGRNRIYLPQDDLDRFGFSTAHLLNRDYNKQFGELMAFQSGRVRAFYRTAANHLPDVDRKSMFPAETMGEIYFAILEKIEARGYRVFDQRVTVSAPYKIWIAAKNWLIR